MMGNKGQGDGNNDNDVDRDVDNHHHHGDAMKGIKGCGGGDRK